jgi:hypothetical protein
VVLSFEGGALGGGVISTCPSRRTGVEHAKRPRCSGLLELLKPHFVDFRRRTAQCPKLP